MPIVWPPVEEIKLKKETIYHSVDGGIRNVSPLGDVIQVINADPDNIRYKIFIINCNSGNVEMQNSAKDLNIASIALRSLNDIAITEIFNNDIDHFLKINDLLLQVQNVNPNLILENYNRESQSREGILRYFETHIIQPDDGILGDTLVANPALVKKRIDHGRKKAEEMLTRFLKRS